MKSTGAFVLVFNLAIIALFRGSSFAQTWTPAAGLPITNWSAVVSSADGTRWFAAAGALYPIAMGYPNFNSPIYSSTNSGLTWQVTTAPYNTWSAIACSADDMHVAATAGGTGGAGPIYVSADSGATWTSASAPTAAWHSIACSAAGDKWVAAAENVIYTSADGGSTWVSNNVPIKSWQLVASSANGNTLFAAEIGYYDLQVKGSIYASTNSGVTWAATGMPQQEWRCLACTADGTKLVAGPGESLSFGAAPLYFSPDSGSSWTSNSLPNGYWNAMASSADGRKLVAASSYSIYSSADGGITWTSNNAPQEHWNSVASCADGSKLAATSLDGGAGGVYLSQFTPCPRLSMMPSNGSLAVSWVVPSTNFVLQESPDLISWSNLTNAPTLNLANLRNQVNLSPGSSRDFYRLAAP